MIIFTIFGLMVVCAIVSFVAALLIGNLIFSNEEGLGIIWFALQASAVATLAAFVLLMVKAVA